MAANLKHLASIISSMADSIDSRCSDLRIKFPSLDEPVSTANLQNSPHLDALILRDISKLLSAATQLIAAAKLPQTYIFNAACAYYLPATLRVATETHVAEILQEAGAHGMHVTEIGARNGIDPNKLARILRYLAVHHIFKEIKPNIFAINRHASVIDTGKTLSEIQADRLRKHDGSSGVAALIGHCTDEDYKGAAYILEHLTNPETASACDTVQTPMMQAVGFSGDVWKWFEEPDNIYRLKRFGCAMKGVSSMQPPETILKGYHWEILPVDSLVVDVGGGIGVATMALARAFPKLKFVVQDRSAVIKEGLAFWKSSFPEALEIGQVTFQEHDFFEPQPVKGPRVFLLKQISHDWADSYLIRILRNLRGAVATASDQPQSVMDEARTELLLIDCIVPYACDTDDVLHGIPGLPRSERLSPLLPNFVDADPSIFYTDLSMYVHFNSQERTIHQLDSVLQVAGWKITRVIACNDQGYCPQIVAHPI